MKQILRNILQQEFLRRGSKNPSYSLRGYAKFLGIHHSTLSGLLSGKRAITSKAVNSLSLKLGLFPDNFIKENVFKLPNHKLLEEDVFNRISEWYFDAILELSKVKSIDFKASNISRHLGISEPQASIAVDILLRLKLLKKTKDGFKIAHANSTNLSSNEKTSAAMRKYQKSILEKSIEALELVERTDRDHATPTCQISYNLFTEKCLALYHQVKIEEINEDNRE